MISFDELLRDGCEDCGKNFGSANEFIVHECREIPNFDQPYPEALWDMDEDIPEYIVENGKVRKTR